MCRWVLVHSGQLHVQKDTNYVCQLPHIILFWGKKSEEGKGGRKEGREGCCSGVGKEGREGCCSGVEEGRYPTLTDKRMYLLKGPLNTTESLRSPSSLNS